MQSLKKVATIFCFCSTLGGVSTSLAAPVVEFDTSLPADFERCKQTEVISSYLDSIAKDDIQKLTHLQKFLLSCQDMLKSSINNDKKKLSSVNHQLQSR